MPIVEYENGQEVIYLPGEDIPDTLPCGARRVVSAPAIRFRGPFSGGTPERLQVHGEAGTPREWRQHAQRQREYIKEKQDKERERIIGEVVQDIEL